MTRHRMSTERRNAMMQAEREVCACCKAIVRRLFADVVGPRAYAAAVLYPSELALAVTLMNAGMPRPDARAALMVRLSVSRRKAYRLIDAALRTRTHDVVPPTRPDAAGLRQLALAIDDERD